MEIKIEIKNLDKIRAALLKSPEIVARHVNIAIHQALNVDLWNAKQKTTPVDLSNLIGTWDVKFSNLRGEMGPRAKYALPVHEGSRPHWTSVKNLEGWAKRHGMNPYALQRSIAKKGTKANPFLKDAIDIAQPSINKRFDTALSNSLNEIANMAGK
jgi:hypothetical protein